MKKVLTGIVGLLVLVAVVAYYYQKPNIDRIGMSTTLFTGAEQYENFSRIREMYPTTMLEAAKNPFVFPEGEPLALPATYEFDGAELSVTEFLTSTDTGALLIVEEGRIRF